MRLCRATVGAAYIYCRRFVLFSQNSFLSLLLLTVAENAHAKGRLMAGMRRLRICDGRAAASTLLRLHSLLVNGPAPSGEKKEETAPQ